MVTAERIEEQAPESVSGAPALMLAPPRRDLRTRLRALTDSWATRSLAVGSVAMLLDIAVLLACIHWFALPNPLSAALGVLVGGTWAFFANRRFAFRAHHEPLGPQAMKFAGATLSGMAVHALVIWLLVDLWIVPVVPAKLFADFAIFTVGQMLLLRFVVFAKKAGAPQPSASAQSHAER